MSTTPPARSRFWMWSGIGFGLGLILGAVAGFFLIIYLIAVTSYPQ